MRLSKFILGNMEPILEQWEVFAATLLPAARDLERAALRDHAQQILEAIAKDLLMPQTREAQSEKSKGRAPQLADAKETAAQTHALLRARAGFDIKQLAAEYRALRASVLRLWMDGSAPAPPDLQDMIRFNEAVDQALAESVDIFSQHVDQARNLLLGMLGHDMRSPLQAVQHTAMYLSQLNAGAEVSQAASILISSGASIKALVDDLVDFNRTRLGLGIKIAPAPVDIGAVFAVKLEQLRTAHPGHRVELDVTGEVRGAWDGRRLQQVLGNLVENAIKHGAGGAPIRVVVVGRETDLLFRVCNRGPVIDRHTIAQLFDPLTRGPQSAGTQDDTGLGLGLYIAREITEAHGGEIEAQSDETETVFAVRLPRRQPPEA